jgi:hypothetical protein
MTLNNFYHESFKKWLKGKCSLQSDAVTDSFEENGIRAYFEPSSQEFIIYPSEKKYPRQIVENTLYQEEDFNSLVVEMLKE